MFTTAIIPVKHLHDSKRRLAHLLSADERADLIGRFLDNLLLTLSATPGIHRTLVVTCDPAVVGLARRRGADVLLEAAADGLNTAAARGTAHALGDGATAVLLLPADLPFARVEDIEAVLRPLTADRRPLREGPGSRGRTRPPAPLPPCSPAFFPGPSLSALPRRNRRRHQRPAAGPAGRLHLPLWPRQLSRPPGRGGPPWPLRPCRPRPRPALRSGHGE